MTIIEKSYPVFNAADIHQSMALVLIRYLLYCSNKEKGSETSKEEQLYTRSFDYSARDTHFLRYPLLRSATVHWKIHVCKLDHCGVPLMEAFDQFFEVQYDAFPYSHGIWKV